MMELIWKILDEYIWGPGFFIGFGLAFHFWYKARGLAQKNRTLMSVLKIIEDGRR